MTDNTRFGLSRRRLLGAVGTVGTAAAIGGAGTTAFFSDEEEFANNQLMAGSLDVKVAYSAHYSDWSPDEDGGDTEDPADDVDVEMWDGPPGTTGGPGDLPAGYTGLPTNAAWLVAVDDPDQFLDNTRYQADGSASCPDGTDAGDLTQPVIELDDVKPGDFGEVTFDFAICDNPGYVFLEAFDATASENGYTEPESTDDDEDGPPTGPGDPATVELLDVAQAAYWVDDGDNYQDGDEAPAAVGSLREILESLGGGGAPLPGDIDAEEGGGSGEQGCFSAETTHSVAFAWWVPVDHGNEIQTDSASFGLRFYTEQCRHNDGVRDPINSFLNDDMVLKESPNWDGSVADMTGQDQAVVENNALTETEFAPFPVPLAFDPLVVRVDDGTTVVWEWTQYDSPPNPPFFNEIPHNVVALDGSFSSGAPVPAGPPADPLVMFSHTFNSPGIYPYYCTPHGALEFVGSSPGEPFDEVINEFGMRGAVIVE
jgi:predicted ribosomally synthesized peptide with SipW-like signal peptide